MNFCKSIIGSVINFDLYKDIWKEKVSKSIIYFLILIAIYAFAVSIGAIYIFNSSKNNIVESIQNDISSLYYKDGELCVNEDKETNIYFNKIMINTSEDEYYTENPLGKIILGKKYVIIKLNNTDFKFKYTDIFDGEFNKDNLIGLFDFSIGYYIIFFIIALIFSYIVFFCSTMLDILIITLIGIIICRIFGNNNLKFKNIFSISIHAITLPVILSIIYYLINCFTGFYIKYFSTMYTAVAIIYMMTAITLISSEDREKGVK